MATMAGRAGACRAELERWRTHLEAAWGADGPPWPELVERFVALLGSMPDPGLLAPTMRAFSTSGAMYVAVYLVLRDRGIGPAEAWAVCERATRARFEGMRGLERAAAASGMFSFPMRWLVKHLESRSRTAPVGGWVARFVAGDAGSDYGVDYDRCAIRDLAVEAGAAEFAPYICNADLVGSEVFGWGLRRSETLAQGGKRCDFRFRRGGETRAPRHGPDPAPEAP